MLDFVNSSEEIAAAFAPYYKATILDKEVNVNLIYDTQTLLREYRLYGDADIDVFIDFYYKNEEQTATDLGKIVGFMKPIIEKYTALDEDDRYEFKTTVNNFTKWYAYISQIVRMYDIELHKEYIFLKYLKKLLPRAKESNVDLDDKIKLEFYKIEETFKGGISFEPKEDYVTLHTTQTLDTSGKPDEEEELLDEIIQRINERVGGDFTESDRVIMETLYKRTYRGENGAKLRKYAKHNDPEMFVRSIFPDIFEKTAQDCYVELGDSFVKLFEDKDFYKLVMEEVGRVLYSAFKEET